MARITLSMVNKAIDGMGLTGEDRAVIYNSYHDLNTTLTNAGIELGTISLVLVTFHTDRYIVHIIKGVDITAQWVADKEEIVNIIKTTFDKSTHPITVGAKGQYVFPEVMTVQ